MHLHAKVCVCARNFFSTSGDSGYGTTTSRAWVRRSMAAETAMLRTPQLLERAGPRLPLAYTGSAAETHMQQTMQSHCAKKVLPPSCRSVAGGSLRRGLSARLPSRVG